MFASKSALRRARARRVAARYSFLHGVEVKKLLDGGAQDISVARCCSYQPNVQPPSMDFAGKLASDLSQAQTLACHRRQMERTFIDFGFCVYDKVQLVSCDDSQTCDMDHISSEGNSPQESDAGYHHLMQK
eukprot:4443869-Amphidinium_carterae.1